MAERTGDGGDGGDGDAAADAARAALIRASAAVAARDPELLERVLRAAAGHAPRLAVEEMLLQAHLFVGFPIALEALSLWREVCGEPAPDPTEEDPAGWRIRGSRVCEAVYADNYARLRANVRAIHPDVDRWMVEGGYGRVIGRPGLDLATRELCIAALLVVWDTPRQLHSHLRGALNTGATAADLRRAVSIAAEFADPDASRRATDLLNRIIG